MEHAWNLDSFCRIHLGFRDVSVAVHLADDGVSPFLGFRRVLGGVPSSWRLSDSGEQGGFGKVEILGGFREEILRRDFHAVTVRAELGEVEISGEDLVFRHFSLDGDGEACFVELAGDRAFRRLFDQIVVVGHAALLDQCVLDVLLRDGRAAGGVSACEVVDEGAGQTLNVDPVVVVEASVLNGDSGILHVLGDLVGSDDDPVLRVEGGDRASVRGEQHGLLRGLDESQVVGAFLEHRGHGIHSGAGGGDHRHDDAGDECSADQAHA